MDGGDLSAVAFRLRQDFGGHVARRKPSSCSILSSRVLEFLSSSFGKNLAFYSTNGIFDPTTESS
jgi:hypothetical protein